MPAVSTFVKHSFAGGWATDFGPQIDAPPDQNGMVQLPFLTDALNTVYELDGGPHMMPGTAQLNSAQMESGAAVLGVFDWWKGSGGTATQRRLVSVNGKIKTDAADGTFTTIKSGLTVGALPWFTAFEDVCVISNDADVPQSYDGATCAALTGSPPQFKWCVKHKNRLWAGGDPAQPSRLYYTDQLSTTAWTTGASGSIDLDPGDGDELVGAASYRNVLLVFKGPNKGSIHQINGSAPTGTDPFSRVTFAENITAASMRTIFRFGDDLGFVSPWGTVHSLAVTASYSGFLTAALSVPINQYIRGVLTQANMKGAWATANDTLGRVLITIPVNGSTTNTLVLCMDYRFQPVRWSYWTAVNCASLAMVKDSSNAGLLTPMAGGYDGYVRKLWQPTRSIDGLTAIPWRVTTPFNSYGSINKMKTMRYTAAAIAPKANSTVTFGWTRDTNAQQTTTFNQGGTDVLGPSTVAPFILGTSKLGGSRYAYIPMQIENGGEFRTVAFEFSSSSNNNDVELHGFAVELTGDAESLEIT